MPATYEPIATTTLGSAASTITFSSIPATYTDLRLVLVASGSVANYPKINFNSDTSALYSSTLLYGDGASVYSTRETGATTVFLDGGYVQMSTTIPSFFTVDIFSYAGSTNKTFLTTANKDKNGSGSVHSLVGLYRSTSAISSLVLGVNTGNFNSGTTATLYGILKA